MFLQELKVVDQRNKQTRPNRKKTRKQKQLRSFVFLLEVAKTRAVSMNSLTKPTTYSNDLSIKNFDPIWYFFQLKTSSCHLFFNITEITAVQWVKFGISFAIENDAREQKWAGNFALKQWGKKERMSYFNEKELFHPSLPSHPPNSSISIQPVSSAYMESIEIRIFLFTREK